MDGGDYTSRDKEGPGIEVAFINAPVPDAAMPFPIPGWDLNMFRNYWMRALSGDVDVPPAILMLVRQSRDDANKSKERSEQEWEELFTQFAVAQRLREIDSLIDRYNQMADWHHEQAEKARAKMREAADKLTEIDEFVSGVDDILRAKEETGKFDREKAIALLRKRGVTVDEKEDDETLLNKIRKEKKLALDEKTNWSRQYDDSKADADYNDRMEQENRKKAQELVERREAIRKHGYDAADKERELTKVAEEYTIDVRHKADKIEEEKQENNHEAANDAAAVGRTNSQSKDKKDKEADFLSSIDELAGKAKSDFNASAANDPRQDAQMDLAQGQSRAPAPVAGF